VNRTIWRTVGVVGAAAVASGLAPAAGAHHSEPNCSWGEGVLPNNMLIRVSVEHPRMMEMCDGTRVRIRLVGVGEFGVYRGSWQEQSDQPARETPAEATGESKRKARKRCKGQKSARTKGKPKCSRERGTTSA